jgi:sugar phosphate isomerase/epimerase
MNSLNPISRRCFLARTIQSGITGLAVSNSWILSTAAEPSIPVPSQAWQIGCYTRPWDQHDYRVALDAIAEAGFLYAGIMTAKGKSWLIITHETSPDEAAQIGAEVKKRGLKALSLYAGEFPVAKSLQAGIQGLRRLIDNCVACGAPNLMLAGTADEKLYKPYFKAVAEVCDYAAAKGIGLSMKPHGGLNTTGPQCRKAVELVGRKNFGIWYDPGNIFYYSDGKLDPVDDASAVDGLVVGMSVKDYRHPKDVMVTPGAGQVNFAKVLARLQQGGFTRGPLIVECLERGDLPKLLDEAKKARRFLETLTRNLKSAIVES